MRYQIKNDHLIFPECGCKFKDNEGIDLDIENCRLDCPATYGLLARGETKGVFQLESHLGKRYSKRLAPDNIDHISYLTAILRPGVLKSRSDEDNMSLTDLFCERKNGRKDIPSFDSAIDDILRISFQILVMQEQAMAIAVRVAGFTEQQADALRKAAGKKLTEEMAKVKIEFLDGVQKLGLITKEKGDQLFQWIENSQRYAFNSGHCLARDTIVRTKTSNKKMSDLIVGEEVYSPQGYTTVEAVIDSEEELYEIKTPSGKTLVCSMDHKIRCEDGEMRKLKDILEGRHKINCL